MTFSASTIYVVASEYAPGQFTNGDLDHPFAMCCVPGANNDCEIDLPRSILERTVTFIKHEKSAYSSEPFRSAINKATRNGIHSVIVCGFLYTSCVLQTALDLRHELEKNIEVIVVRDCCGARRTNTEKSQGESPFDAASRELRKEGVILSDSAALSLK